MRSASNEAEWQRLAHALADAGVDPSDFGRFVSPRGALVTRPSAFDFEMATPILLRCIDEVRDPSVLEAVVRSLSTPWARGVAVDPLLDRFRRTPNDQLGLKWAIGNALATVARPRDLPALYELAIDRSHVGRGMLVGELWRLKDPDPVPELRQLVEDPDCAFAAMTSLRRKIGPEEARPVIEPLTRADDERLRNAARENLRRIDKRVRRKSLG